MKWGDFFQFAGGAVSSAGGVVDGGGKTGDWMSWGGSVLGSLGGQIGTSPVFSGGQGTIYVPQPVNQGLGLDNKTLTWVIVGVLAFTILKKR